MKRDVRVFSSFEDAERADAEYFAALTPQERVDMLLDMIAAYREATGAPDRIERVYRVVRLDES